MISSIVLLLLQYFGVVNTDKGIEFLKWYFLWLAVETVIYVITIPKIMDKFDAWRNKK